MKNSKLFVGNLAPGVTEKDLKEQFSYFGEIRFIKIIESKGIAFVKMYRESDAYYARLGLNGVKLHDRPIRVLEARSEKRNPKS